MIVFRCDAGPEIGGGHLMRCIALARACAERGLQACFASAELCDADRHFIEAWGFATVDLPSGENQAQALADVAGEVLVLDRYLLPPDYIEPWLSSGRPVLQLVDGAAPLDGVSVALDQNLDARIEPKAGRVDLCGLRYALLRPEFRTAASVNDDDESAVPPRLLVTMGAADTAGLTAVVVEACEPLIDDGALRLEVVIGPHATDPELASRPAVSIHHSPPDMAALMARSSLAVATSGSSLWELFAVGLPRIVVPVADNQKPLAEAALRHGAAVVLRPDALRARRPLREAINALLADDQARAKQRAAGLKLVDGAGARRVAQVIEGLLQGQQPREQG